MNLRSSACAANIAGDHSVLLEGGVRVHRRCCQHRAAYVGNVLSSGIARHVTAANTGAVAGAASVSTLRFTAFMASPVLFFGVLFVDSPAFVCRTGSRPPVQQLGGV
ncbi:MAG: hypothetical protein ABIT83_05135 [Massilia sp.]